jgi:hypothetical protein
MHGTPVSGPACWPARSCSDMPRQASKTHARAQPLRLRSTAEGVSRTPDEHGRHRPAECPRLAPAPPRPHAVAAAASATAIGSPSPGGRPGAPPHEVERTKVLRSSRRPPASPAAHRTGERPGPRQQRRCPAPPRIALRRRTAGVRIARRGQRDSPGQLSVPAVIACHPARRTAAAVALLFGCSRRARWRMRLIATPPRSMIRRWGGSSFNRGGRE